MGASIEYQKIIGTTLDDYISNENILLVKLFLMEIVGPKATLGCNNNGQFKNKITYNPFLNSPLAIANIVCWKIATMQFAQSSMCNINYF